MKKLILFVCVITVINFWDDIKEIVSPTPDFSAMHEERVVLYATSWCSVCTRIRAFFKNNGIDYYEYDIEKSTEGLRQFDILKGKGIPLVQIEGKVFVGFNSKVLLDALDIEKS